MRRDTPEDRALQQSQARYRIQPNYRARVTAIASLDALLHLKLADSQHQLRADRAARALRCRPAKVRLHARRGRLEPGASLLVEHRQFGGATSKDAPDPVRLVGSLSSSALRAQYSRRWRTTTEVGLTVDGSIMQRASSGWPIRAGSTPSTQRLCWRRGVEVSAVSASPTSSTPGGRREVRGTVQARSERH